MGRRRTVAELQSTRRTTASPARTTRIRSRDIYTRRCNTPVNPPWALQHANRTSGTLACHYHRTRYTTKRGTMATVTRVEHPRLRQMPRPCTATREIAEPWLHPRVPVHWVPQAPIAHSARPTTAFIPSRPRWPRSNRPALQWMELTALCITTAKASPMALNSPTNILSLQVHPQP